EALGLDCIVLTSFDTDRFGTFTREIERTGTQLDAALGKIAAAFEHGPNARVAIASEGSFGPHPWLPLGRELVLLVVRQTGLELAGHDATLDAHFAHCIVDGPAPALAFAERMPSDTPILMLNLLRFNSQAAYGADSPHAPCSGREAYARYSRTALSKVRG
ncbi:DUF6671 family protein, partial [Acinetobacter baumannii]|uniref:DUF6671 family protein n=1 Tax=Acinetobacter baumannii TaxID=470 RepID=UPI0034D304FB